MCRRKPFLHLLSALPTPHLADFLCWRHMRGCQRSAATRPSSRGHPAPRCSATLRFFGSAGVLFVRGQQGACVGELADTCRGESEQLCVIAAGLTLAAGISKVEFSREVTDLCWLAPSWTSVYVPPSAKTKRPARVWLSVWLAVVLRGCGSPTSAASAVATSSIWAWT